MAFVVHPILRVAVLIVLIVLIVHELVRALHNAPSAHDLHRRGLVHCTFIASASLE
jgi:hypothetical protein